MASNYPTSLDSYAALVDNTDGVVAAHPNDRGDAIENLEAKVGVDSSAVATSHDYLLTHLPAQVQNWDAGAYEVRAQTLEADVTTGTAPLTITSTTVVSNLNVDQVDGKDSTDFVLCDGTQALTANWDVGAYTLTGTRFISDIATGTSPFGATSTTVCTNLNADLLDGAHKPTGTIVGTTDTQTLTNKTLTAPDINGGTADALTSLTVANSVDIGPYELRAATLESDVATGTAPLTITSTTPVDNLGIYFDHATIASEARGDILYRAASAWSRLGKGTSGQILTMGASDPAWATGAKTASGTYTGNGTAGTAVAHGLGATPKFVAISSTVTQTDYAVWITGMSSTIRVVDGHTTGSTTSAPNATNFYLPTETMGNRTGVTYYWFAST